MRPLLSRQQLVARHCAANPGERPYAPTEVEAQLTELPGWSYRDGSLERGFSFGNYHDTIAFVNALAWMVHREDHHPELAVGYNRCVVRWNTHSAGGITDNDFICAAKTDAVFGRGGN